MIDPPRTHKAKHPMRRIGPRGSLLVSGLVGLLVLAPLAAFAPLAGGLVLAAGAALAAILLHRRAAALAERCEKLSGEFDVLSRRLLRLEAASNPPAKAAPEPAALASGIEEITAEIGLLSGIVRELAAVVAVQDGDIARLKAGPRASAPAPRAAPARPPAPRMDVPAAPQPPGGQPRTEAPVPAGGHDRPTRVRATGREEDAALVAAFDRDGLEIYLQPVVTLPQRKVLSYEALARLRVGGEILAPDAFLPALERHGRTTELDRRMLQRVVTIARHLHGRRSEARLAYGLSPLSLFEPDFLRSLPRLVGSEPDLAGRIAVALPQASWRSLDAEQAGALAALRDRIGFTLDRPVDLDLDAAALAERGVSAVKIPADLLLRPTPRRAVPDGAVERLVAALGRAGLRLVATEVEREAEVPDLIDLGVPLAQGGAFAAPRPVRAEVLAAAPQAPAAAPPADEMLPPQRRPFRDFLRRAG